MQKWIGAGVLVAAAGAGLAWQQGWFDGGAAPLTAYVPADTVLYVGGQADADQAEQLRKLPLMANSQFQAKQLLAELERSNRRQTPQSQFALNLFADFIRNANTYGDMVEHYGIDLTRPQALYMDGMVPVLRFGLKDEAAFWQVLDQASADSGLQPREESIGGTTVKIWRLNPQEDKALELAVNVRDGVATLTAFHFLDQDADRQQRLALTKPAQSLADSGELAQLQKTYKFDDSMQALLHFQRLAQGVLQPESNSFGQDLSALFKAQNEPLPGSRMDAACRDEALNLIAQVPRLVAGNTYSRSGKTLEVQSRSVLELTNTELVKTLSSMRGHIPGHVAHSDGQILGFGTGLNIDNLVPAATTLFNSLTAYESNCREIQRMQRNLSGANPAMMAMFTGMVQGAQGVGFSLYDLKLDGNSPIPSSYDFLFSIATSNPQPLLGMLSMSPFGRQVQIPTDGSLTDVDLSFIAPGLSLKAGVQGNHLVAFAGDKAQQAVDKLKDESLEPNGLTRLSANYARFADLIDAIPPQVMSEVDAGMSRNGCVAQAQLSHMLRSQGASIDYGLDITEQGVSADLAMTLDTSANAPIDPVGQYYLTDLTYDCKVGEPWGEEELRADNTGSYRYAADGCDQYRSEYTWRQEGNLLTIEATQAESRDSCEAEWTEVDGNSYQCQLMPAEKGFRCLLSDDDRESLLHFEPRS